MSAPFALVDLFAGPGGLSEGFVRTRLANGDPAFELAMSVECEAAAHATLRLRNFLREFGERPPASYEMLLAGRISVEELAARHPKEWRRACHATMRLELGTPAAEEAVPPAIERIRERFAGDTVLLGGPPCQAYSLIGRARNAGNPAYDPATDRRHHLYREYLRVLEILRPAAFVMENVKGLLSARVREEKVFARILDDLRGLARADGGYEILAFSPSGKQLFAVPEDPRDFVVRAEDFGVPQARHRVFVIGVRRDRLRNTPVPAQGERPGPTLGDALAGLPPVRSGLSRGDGFEAWRETVLAAFDTLDRPELLRHIPAGERFRQELRLARSLFQEDPPRLRAGQRVVAAATVSSDLVAWLRIDPSRTLAAHETRGHMPDDLARYLFVAVFGRAFGRSPTAEEFPPSLAPRHRSWWEGKFADRFRVHLPHRPAGTITSHAAKDGHYYIHHDPVQCRSLTVREAARLQTFPDDYHFVGNRTQQYVQVGNAVPPLLAHRIALWLLDVLGKPGREETTKARPRATEQLTVD